MLQQEEQKNKKGKDLPIKNVKGKDKTVTFEGPLLKQEHIIWHKEIRVAIFM